MVSFKHRSQTIFDQMIFETSSGCFSRWRHIKKTEKQSTFTLASVQSRLEALRPANFGVNSNDHANPALKAGPLIFPV